MSPDLSSQLLLCIAVGTGTDPGPELGTTPGLIRYQRFVASSLDSLPKVKGHMASVIKPLRGEHHLVSKLRGTCANKNS